MQKKYIRMNNNDEHLSIGNLFRIIKDSSKNKMSALQSEMFCILFDLEYINDTTVNNYCVGCRSIGAEYKQIFLSKERKYEKDIQEFASNIIGLINVMDGVVHTDIKNKVLFINESESARGLAKKLYNLAKNDNQIINEFTNKLYQFINDGKIYECLVEELIFIVIHKKQPIYEDELKKEVFENVLNDTSISSIDLQEYLSLKLREGINFDYSMKKLADSGNAYASFELGSNEYYGYVTGEPRYDKAYMYLEKAALCNHAGANYMIGNMFIKGLIGGKSKEELECGYNFLVKSYELGNVAAGNLIGNMYLNGIYPLEKNEEEAIKYYEKASNSDYAFAINNLGKIKEREGKLKEAFELYKRVADLGESWACNKVGEFYRIGKVTKNMKLAFQYYNKALESNYRTVCYYAYYNLAKYFYYDGYGEVVLSKDREKAILYYEKASNNGILEATIELLKININKYINIRDNKFYEEIYRLKRIIEGNSAYNEKIREEIENIIGELIEKKEINVKVIDDLNVEL